MKCNACASAFQTESGLKVHNDLVHHNKLVNKEELKCKHCITICSYLDVMNKHIVREHGFNVGNVMQHLNKNETFRLS